ncbi:hypothetical protein HYALB_00009045 [Hymenoscyphus albidus]|uniref:Uncharacterized protein n=1 Tax=Hymenoscyphus albidus TaxID=595503 RepID=A0A9N9LFM5_9HELO|nr:hypothetical protein HYALB_00009045 [Hymenoscyphus albidus]
MSRYISPSLANVECRSGYGIWVSISKWFFINGILVPGNSPLVSYSWSAPYIERYRVRPGGTLMKSSEPNWGPWELEDLADDPNQDFI